MSEPKHDPNDPDNAQVDIISHPTRAQSVDSNNATTGSTNADEESTRNVESIESDNDI